MATTRRVHPDPVKGKAQDEWNDKIDELEQKSDEAEAKAKAEREKQISKLKERRSEVEAKLEELQEASDDAWKS